MDNRVLEIILRARNEAQQTLKQASSQAEKLGKSFEKAGRSVTDTGQAMVVLGAAPAAALGLATKAAISFESSFAGVRKTVDASEAEFKRLADNFRNISKTTPVAVNDLNRIGELAGQLGIRGVENLTKFTKTIADIAVTTNLTTEEAAMAFARIANIMQEPIANIDRLGATIVDLGNNFATTEAEITEYATRIAGAGKIAGMSTADVLAIGTAFSSVGVQAEAGGTAIQKVLISMYQAASGATSSVIDNSAAIAKNTAKLEKLKQQLQGATMRQSEFTDKTKESTKFTTQARIDQYGSAIAEAEEKLAALNATHGQAAISGDSFAKVLGVTNKQFQEMFKKDPSAVFEKFVTKLGEISKEGGDAAGVLEELGLADQRLVRGFLSVSNAGDLLSRTLTVGGKAWQQNTALTEEARKRYETVESQLQIAKNNLYDIGITIGNVVLPRIVDLLETVRPLVQSFAAFAEKHPVLIAGLLGIGATIGVVGIALIGLGATITALGTIITAFGAIAAIALSPITLIIVAIGAAVALLALAWSENWGGIQDKAQAVADWFQNTAWPVIQAVFAYITEGVGQVASQWGERFDLMINSVQKLSDFIGGSFVPVLKEHAALITKIIDSATGGWIVKIDFVTKSFNDVANAIGAVISKIDELTEKATGKNIGGVALDHFLRSLLPIHGYATGTNFAPGGLALVGERGPELVQLPRGSKVYTNEESRSMMSGGPSIQIAQVVIRQDSDIETLARRLEYYRRTGGAL